jgi:hypothetical protein
MRLKMETVQKLLNSMWGVPKSEENAKLFQE